MTTLRVDVESRCGVEAPLLDFVASLRMFHDWYCWAEVELEKIESELGSWKRPFILRF